MNPSNSSVTSIDRSITDRVVSILHSITGNKVNFIGEGGVIISSAQPERVGTVHEGGKMIMDGEADELAITPEMASGMKGALPGYNGAIYHNGKKIGVIGIGGDPEIVKPLQKMAEIIIQDEISKIEQKKSEIELKKKFVEQITDLSDNMKVLALNGSIQAAKLGRTGDAFKVVAAEMKKFAEDINNIISQYEY